MRSLPRLVLLAALVVGGTACDNATPTQPDQESATALAAAQVELASIAGVLPGANDTDPATAPQPLLARLTRVAIEQLSSSGAERLRVRAVTELRARQADLSAAIASGDRASTLRAKRALELTAARIVTTVLSPRIVTRVIGLVAGQVQTLSGRVDAAAAEGRDVAGPRRVLARVASMLRESNTVLERGDAVEALIIATTAGDVLHTAFNR